MNSGDISGVAHIFNGAPGLSGMTSRGTPSPPRLNRESPRLSSSTV